MATISITAAATGFSPPTRTFTMTDQVMQHFVAHQCFVDIAIRQIHVMAIDPETDSRMAFAVNDVALRYMVPVNPEGCHDAGARLILGPIGGVFWWGHKRNGPFRGEGADAASEKQRPKPAH